MRIVLSSGKSIGKRSKSLLHISAQGFVERKFGQFGPTCRSVCMPLGSRRTILQPAASGSRVASQFTGDCRGGPTEAAPDLLHGVALHLEKCDLLALGQRQVPPGERLCRESEHCWWHAARLSEQSGSDRLRYSGFERSFFTAQPRGNPPPKSALFITPRHLWPPRRWQWRSSRSCRSPSRILIATSNVRVLRRPLESAQYASIAYRQRLADRDIIIGRPYNPFDNAKADSFMKTEEINGKDFADLSDARRRINGFIAGVYNKDRLHSALGYQSPREFETAFAQNRARERIVATALSQKLSCLIPGVQSSALFDTTLPHSTAGSCAPD